MHYKYQHTIETDLDTFWNRIFFDPEFNETFYVGCLGCSAYRLAEDRTEADGTRHRRIECTPKIDLPGPAKKIFGDTLGYAEVGRYDPSARRFHFEIVPSTASDKIKTDGQLWIEAAGDKRITRSAAGEAAVKIFGLGSLLEGVIEKQARETYDKSAEFTNRWIRTKGL